MASHEHDRLLATVLGDDKGPETGGSHLRHRSLANEGDDGSRQLQLLRTRAARHYFLGAFAQIEDAQHSNRRQ